MRLKHYQEHILSHNKEWPLGEESRGHGNAQAPRDSGL